MFWCRESLFLFGCCCCCSCDDKAGETRKKEYTRTQKKRRREFAGYFWSPSSSSSSSVARARAKCNKKEDDAMVMMMMMPSLLPSPSVKGMFCLKSKQTHSSEQPNLLNHKRTTKRLNIPDLQSFENENANADDGEGYDRTSVFKCSFSLVFSNL